MTQLYFDCSMGAAGDMLTAALFELFDNKEEILEKLNSIGIPGIRYEAQRVQSHSITGTHMHVYFEGREEQQDCPEHHDHDHGHQHHHHGMDDIRGLVSKLALPEKVKGDVINVYTVIAQAEAQVHGMELDNIHFHELGTMDALADISAVCYLIYLLNPGRITASPIRLGYGTVKCAHGIMPVPAPATALIIKGLPVFPGDIEHEMCTPTGAALLKYFVQEFSAMPAMTPTAVGCGMGTKEFERPNFLRAICGETQADAVELSCNVDDMSPEAIGFALQTLMNAGALDAWYECIGMKKFRPGIMLSCLCRCEDREKMLELIFKHTSSIGVRETLCRRYVLRRHSESLETPYGAVPVKVSEGYGVEKRKAEYEALAEIAGREDLSLSELSALLKL